MASTILVEKRQELDAARKDAREFYGAHPDPKDMTGDDRAASVSHSAKMADLHDEVVALEADEKGREDANTSRKSAGRAVTEDDGELKGSAAKAFDLEDALANSAGMKALLEKGQAFRGTAEIVKIPTYKTLLTLGDMTPAPQRTSLVPSVQDETTVADLMLSGTTSSNVLSYYEETTFTNAAASVAEAGTKPEAALDFTERTDTVRKIATWIPATSEFLEDNEGLRSYIEQRLVFMLKQAEEDALLNGNGTAPNISGILDRSGVQSIGSTNDLDSIYRAITEVRVDGGAEPTAVVIHPLSWQNLRLAKSVSDGQYFGPGPFAPDNVERIWGLQVRVTPKIAEGTALVGAFRPHAQVFRKGGISVLASTEHASYFIENKVAILVEERLALAVYRPTAFCSVTGLASS